MMITAPAMTVRAPARSAARCELARRARAARSEPRAYLSGYLVRHSSIAGVATEMGVSTRTVYNWLARYSIQVTRIAEAQE
jgi:transposase